jgi:hypothetical protein
MDLLDEVGESYDVDDLADQLECSTRTVIAYIRERDLYLPDINPYTLPLYTRRGRMLVVSDKKCDNCGECPMEELCQWLVWHDCFIACERPLDGEVIGEVGYGTIEEFDARVRVLARDVFVSSNDGGNPQSRDTNTIGSLQNLVTMDTGS